MECKYHKFKKTFPIDVSGEASEKNVHLYYYLIEELENTEERINRILLDNGIVVPSIENKKRKAAYYCTVCKKLFFNRT